MFRDFIMAESAAAKGRIGIYYKNLVTGEVIANCGNAAFDSLRGEPRYTAAKIDENDVFESASVIKIWIMAAAFDLMDKGRLKADDKVVLKSSDKVPSDGLPDYAAEKSKGILSDDMFPESGVLNCMHTGIELEIMDVLKLMILISDNTATNIMIDTVGLDTVNEFIAKCGMKKTKLNRKLFDSTGDMQNVISLEETAWFFEKLYRNELVSPEASRTMAAILQNQQITYKLPFFIRDIPIAHKTGEDTGIANDVGLIYAENPFILCFAANGADEPQADRLCQEVAQRAYNYSLKKE